jgi:hypothetical protein
MLQPSTTNGRSETTTRLARRRLLPRASAATLLALTVALAASGSGSAAPTPAFTRVTTIGVGPFPSYGMTRTANGTLHLIYQTTAPGSSAPDGLATRAISPAGAVGPQTQALSGWTPGRAGLVALPDGTLEAVFGAVSPQNVGGLWGISSSDGGATWTAPADVTSGGPVEAVAYASDVTAQLAGSTPVLTAAGAGGIVIQQGLGGGTPAQQITDASNNFAGDVNSAVDADAGEVVVTWQSNAGSGGDFIQAVAPTVGAAQKAPGQVRNQLVIAGRDSGPGVFAAYTTDGTHVFLLRYGGGSVPVGSVSGVTATILGVATGQGGRIWVMWGNEGGGLAVTRSNKAVTRFEPIQHLDYHPFTLHRLAGDGRLGPLDLLVDEIPSSKSGPAPAAGTFHARVLPELSATLSVKTLKKKGQVIGHTLTVHVTDAGDPVAGATVSAAGKKAKTSAAGVAKLTFAGAKSASVAVTITATGYQALTKKVKL